MFNIYQSIVCDAAIGRNSVETTIEEASVIKGVKMATGVLFHKSLKANCKIRNDSNCVDRCLCGPETHRCMDGFAIGAVR